MKPFSAFHYGGRKDGQLALFYGGFRSRDFVFSGFGTVSGEPGAVFHVGWDEAKEQYITAYPPMVRAARNMLREAG